MTVFLFGPVLRHLLDHQPLAALAVSRDMHPSLFAILIWLLESRGLIWVSQVLLAPLLMGAVLAICLRFGLRKPSSNSPAQAVECLTLLGLVLQLPTQPWTLQHVRSQ